MHAPSPRALPAPAIVLPMVRVDPAKIERAVSQGAKRAARRAALKVLRCQHKKDAVARIETDAAVLVETVAAHWNLPAAALRGRSRVRVVTAARHAAMLLTIDVLGCTVARAASALGRGHHTTALLAVRGLRAKMAADPRLAAEIAALGLEVRRALDAAI